MNAHFSISHENKHMTYTQKISFYTLFSLLIHLCVFLILSEISSKVVVTSYSSMTKPIKIEFVKREQKERIKKLVEVIEHSDESPSNTENIAEFNSISSAPVKKEGDLSGPSLLEESKVETLGSEKKETQVANIIPQPEKQSITKYEPTILKKKEPSRPDVLPVEKEKTTIQKQEIDLEEEKVLAKDEKTEKVLESPQYLGDTFQKPQGKLYNQVKKEGVLGFEALQDQLAPYLKEIQKKVEKYWLHYLLTRYSGTKSTEVIIDCEINSKGKIVRIDIIGKPDDALFAGICKQALQKSEPFSPFPFQVPDIYQNKNLQIRWTFRFL